MKSENVKVGFIGCGWIVENAHIPAFHSLEGVTINSLFDADINKASRLAQIYNVPFISDNISEFFNSGIDAVVIATPNNTHAQYSLKALENGLHVLCEKPIAINSSDVLQVINMAKERNRLFIPGFVNRFRYDIAKVCELIQAKRVGDIVSIEAGWLRKSGIPRPGTWFTNKAHSGGGVLIDLGSHVIDICLKMLNGKEPLSVKSKASRHDEKIMESDAQWLNKEGYKNELQIDIEDTVQATVKFEGDITLNLKLSWAADVKGDCTYFIVNGTKGSIKLKTLFGFSTNRMWKDDSLVIENGARIESIPLDKSTNNTRRAFFDMARFFVEVIKGKNSNYLTDIDGLKNVELIEKLYDWDSKVYSENTAFNMEELRIE